MTRSTVRCSLKFLYKGMATATDSCNPGWTSYCIRSSRQTTLFLQPFPLLSSFTFSTSSPGSQPKTNAKAPHVALDAMQNEGSTMRHLAPPPGRVRQVRPDRPDQAPKVRHISKPNFVLSHIQHDGRRRGTTMVRTAAHSSYRDNHRADLSLIPPQLRLHLDPVSPGIL